MNGERHLSLERSRRQRPVVLLFVACAVLAACGTGSTVAKSSGLFGGHSHHKTMKAPSARVQLHGLRVQLHGLSMHRRQRIGITFYKAYSLCLRSLRRSCDTTPPDTTITSGPPATTAETSAGFSFTSSESGSTFACRLDAGSWSSCSSPKSYSSLSLGEHSFSVRAIDAAGNVDSTPASASWTVVQPPEPAHAVWSSPSGAMVGTPVTLDGSASTGAAPMSCTWSFENEDGTTVWETREGCRIDFTFQGTGMKYVRLIVQAGDGSSDSNKQSFSVASTETTQTDTTPPDTTITSGPPATTAETSAGFSCTSSESGSTFACRLDAGSWSSCSSPKSYSSLSLGEHSFSVRAIDAAGNVDSTPAVRSWRIESTSTAPAGSHCFSLPSSCGFPDASNTGVPTGTSLTNSGSLTLSTPGQVVSGLNITGSVTVTAKNVTIRNSKLHTTSGGSGARAVTLNNGAENFTIEDSEVYGNGSTTNAPESAVWNHYDDPGFKVVRSYIHGSPDNIEGRVDVKDSYLLVDAMFSGAHAENVYICSTSVNVEHSTLINQVSQTATVFGDTICGGGNKYTVTNSLLAGGGYIFYPQANNTNPAGAQTTITDNRIARCSGTPETRDNGNWYCSGGSDSNGLFPYGGSYGVGSYFSGPITWSGNVWDDNLASVPKP